MQIIFTEMIILQIADYTVTENLFLGLLILQKSRKLPLFLSNFAFGPWITLCNTNFVLG